MGLSVRTVLYCELVYARARRGPLMSWHGIRARECNDSEYILRVGAA